jgi:hypothetical protein
MRNITAVEGAGHIITIPTINCVAGTSIFSNLDSSRMSNLLVGTVNLTTFGTGIIKELWYAIAATEYCCRIV